MSYDVTSSENLALFGSSQVNITEDLSVLRADLMFCTCPGTKAIEDKSPYYML